MKQVQYQKIRYARTSYWDYNTRTIVHVDVEYPDMIVTKGKHKGKKVSFVRCHSPKIDVKEIGVEDAETLSIHYTELEYMDEDGNPKPEPVCDMTGREIAAGKFVVYSVHAGNSSHALEIGKVEEITKTGGVKVTRTVRNGEKVAEWRGVAQTKTLNDPDRALVLPVEVSTLTSWVLQEFEGLKDQE